MHKGRYDFRLALEDASLRHLRSIHKLISSVFYLSVNAITNSHSLLLIIRGRTDTIMRSDIRHWNVKATSIAVCVLVRTTEITLPNPNPYFDGGIVVYLVVSIQCKNGNPKRRKFASFNTEMIVSRQEKTLFCETNSIKASVNNTQTL